MKWNDKAYQAARAAILKAMAERNCIIAGVPFNENNTDEFDAGEAAEHAKVALDAAYAAQFKSEDYAGLVKWLRDKAESLSEIYPPEAEAADAIEALLAKLNNKPKPSEDYAGLIERLRKNSVWGEVIQELAMVRAERDALAARLQATAEREKLREDIKPRFSPKSAQQIRDETDQLIKKHRESVSDWLEAGSWKQSGEGNE